jgi:hypothetical protein
MSRTFLALISFLLVLPCLRAAGPTMETVIADPATYAGKSLTFSNATLAGKVTTYDVGNVRKYYLLVQSAGKRLEPGFFLAPPALADKLAANLDARTNYSVNLTCKVERITINEVPQWHGIVTRVDLLDGEGNVTRTIKIDPK